MRAVKVKQKLGMAAIMLVGLMLCGVAVAAFPAPAAGTRVVEYLEDGPEIILEPHPEAEVVCLAVALKAGSARETPPTRGVSHFLEHLLFDGTERYTRQDISSWVENNGAFLNAFTRKETTVYFLLVNRGLLEEGMEILSQMLFHSVFPPAELEKERKVVREEIRQTADGPGEARERLVSRYLLRGSNLVEPVLGYPITVDTIERQEIIRYYRENYSPSGMKIFIMGGFDPRQARGWIDDYFPGTKSSRSGRSISRDRSSGKGTATGPRTVPGGNASIPRWSSEITVRAVPGLDPGLDLLVRLPGMESRDFPAVLLLDRILEGEDSPLAGKFAECSLPLPRLSLEIYSSFCALRLQLKLEEEKEDDYLAVPGLLASLASWKPSPEELEAARVSILSADAFDREKYHYYLMLHGERIGLAGNRYLESSTEGVKNVGPEDMRRLLAGYFDPPLFNGILLQDERGPGSTGEAPPAPVSRQLANGCRIASFTRTGSGIAALHILIMRKNCMESGFFPGISVVLNKALENSGAGRELEEKLTALGARLLWGDNPYIPMDDYYLSPAWSFIRLEAPAENMARAIPLMVSHLLQSPLGPADLEDCLKGLGRELAVRSGSPAAILETHIFKELFGGHPYGSALYPSPSSLGGLSASRIDTFRKSCWRGSNLLVTLVSPLGPDKGLEMLEDNFSRFPSGRAVSCPPLPETFSPGVREDSIKKEGVYLAWGFSLRDPSPEGAAALKVAGEVLSRRMQLQIREVEGLAYSTGCGVSVLERSAVAMASLSTRRENLDSALVSLRRQLEQLYLQPPTSQEVITAKNRLLARSARRELSSINQAYALGLDLFLRRGSSQSYWLNRVGQREVEDMIKESFDPSRGVLIKLIPVEGGEEKKSMPRSMRR
ncbi:MAG: insulinase family protein [Candidatus Krumholzibacteriota bacterium]|nr:insulinase family protein [Candidatus Krumholzibacteriota bacterium]